MIDIVLTAENIVKKSEGHLKILYNKEEAVFVVSPLSDDVFRTVFLITPKSIAAGYQSLNEDDKFVTVWQPVSEEILQLVVYVVE